MNNIHSSPHAGLRARFRIFILLLLLALLFIPLVVVMLFVVEIEDAVYCNGVVVPDEYYEVVSHLNARVTKLNFRTGDEVKQGDVIAELDSLTYENDALEAQAAIAELKAEYELKKSELQLLEKEPLPQLLWHSEINYKEAVQRADKAKEKLERYRTLIESNAISKIEFDTAELEYIQLQAEVVRAEANRRRVQDGLADSYVKKARNELALVQAKLDGRSAALAHYRKLIADCKLRAPADGRIVEIQCRDTMYVEQGKTAVTLAGGGDLMVIAEVDERFIRKIRLGQKARVSSEVFNRLQYGSFSAEVVKIGYIPLPSASTGGMTAYPVKMRLDPDGCDIRIGSRTAVTLITGKRPAIFALLNISDEDLYIKKKYQRKMETERLEREKAKREKETSSPEPSPATGGLPVSPVPSGQHGGAPST